MSTAPDLIAEIHSALDSNTREFELLALIENRLTVLRQRYKTHRNEFSSEGIEFLRSLSPLQEALREFGETIDEKDWVRTRDDAQEIASRFSDLAELLSPYLVSKRAEMEIRDVLAKAKTLPFAAVSAGEAEFKRRFFALESTAKPCLKCGAKMVLRESQYGYFWGCSTFPRCFSRKWLTKEESEQL